MSRLPYEHVRILEQCTTLTGRLVGLLFADQGADVFVEREGASTSDEHNAYLDRGKVAVLPGGLADTSSADVIIVDGAVPVSRAASQIVLRVTAAIPGDDIFGHRPRTAAKTCSAPSWASSPTWRGLAECLAGL